MSETPRVTPAKRAEPAPGTRAPLTPLDLAAFVCELVAFGSLALWGFAAWSFPWNILVGIAAPVVALVIWALFVSPRAVFAVHPFVRALVELLVYGAATMAWWSLGQAWIGIIFGVVAVTVGVLAGRRRLA